MPRARRVQERCRLRPGERTRLLVLQAPLLRDGHARPQQDLYSLTLLLLLPSVAGEWHRRHSGM